MHAIRFRAPARTSASDSFIARRSVWSDGERPADFSADFSGLFDVE